MKRRSRPVLTASSVRASIERHVRRPGPGVLAVDYEHQLDQAYLGLLDLMDAQRYGDVIELAELFINRLEEIWLLLDDPYEATGSTLSRLMELHVEACEKAGVGGPQLAERLARWEATSRCGAFGSSLLYYRHLLGDEGPAVYRRIVEPLWEAHGRDPRLDRMMTMIARVEGNADEEARVLARDLTRPCSYLRIARAYERDEQYEVARQWAQRGHEAFPDDEPLRAFLGLPAQRELDVHERCVLAAMRYHDVRYEVHPTALRE